MSTFGFDELLALVYRKRMDQLERAAAHGAQFDARGSDGRTLVMHAALDENPDADVVRWLIEHGAEPNVPETTQRWTALHYAARDGKADVVEVLLECGASVDAKDMFGNTPLWRCVASGDRKHAERMIETARLLLRAGADPRRKNNYDISPIDCEAKHLACNAELLALLRGESRGVA